MNKIVFKKFMNLYFEMYWNIEERYLFRKKFRIVLCKGGREGIEVIIRSCILEEKDNIGIGICNLFIVRYFFKFNFMYF